MLRQAKPRAEEKEAKGEKVVVAKSLASVVESFTAVPGTEAFSPWLIRRWSTTQRLVDSSRPTAKLGFQNTFSVADLLEAFWGPCGGDDSLLKLTG